MDPNRQRANLPAIGAGREYLDEIGWKPAGALVKAPAGFDEIPEPPDGAASWQAYLTGLFGDKIYSGQNKSINELLDVNGSFS